MLHGGEARSKLCTFVKYPNHSKKYFRQKYGQVLMKEVKSISGKKMFYPVKTFCYLSIKESLRTLPLRPGFEIECEKRRSQNHSEDVLADVHDGEIWKNFTHDGTNLFSSKPHNYGVMLNVDWFRPFKHLSSFSIGGIYLVLLNLPYHLRFKRKNLFLVSKGATNRFIS